MLWPLEKEKIKNMLLVCESDRLFFTVNDFDTLIELPFEDTVVNAPKNWDENLTRLYKDYMAMPPEEKRNSGHDVYRVFVD